MPKTSNNNKKGNQVNFRIGDEMSQSLDKCCELLSVNRSDFIRFAINQAINQTMLQGVCMTLYEQMKNADINNMTDKQLAEFEVLINVLRSVSGDNGDSSLFK